MRLAFLGCGFATRLHSKTLRSLGRFGREVRRLYASRDGEKARAYDRRFRGAGWFDSYAAAIGSDDVDVVLVATPPASHKELVLEALRAGKDAIVEKPAFLRSTDFDAVERAAAETGRRVFVAENYHYKPVARRLTEILAAGLIGEVQSVQVNATKLQKVNGWRAEPGLAGGGALFEGGIHWVHFMAHLGIPVRAVSGFTPDPPDGFQASMLATFHYQGGAVGTLNHSWAVPSLLGGLRLSKITGRNGSITFESNGVFLFVNGAKRRLLLPGIRDIAGYRAMFRDFIRAWQTGGEPRMRLAHARRDLELVESIIQTAAEA